MSAEFSTSWYSSESPEVSIIIITHNHSEVTAQGLHYLFANTERRKYEVIIVDNGSEPTEFRRLSELLYNFHLIRLPVNRYFGEGNNIGFEASRGKFVVFLRSNTFVAKGWLEPLIVVLESQFAAGGVGPKILLPNGRLQEAGSFVDCKGATLQRGRNYVMKTEELENIGIVDYCSSACFATTRELFDRVSGFDPTYEPACYEDSDLCLKIASLGRFIYYCPQSTIYQSEGGSAASFAQQLALEDIVETNRRKFLSRWSDYLSRREVDGTASPLPLPPTRQRAGPVTVSLASPTAVFHSPYDLIPGGGERYLLTAASALTETHRVYVVTEARYSQFRLDFMARELALDLSGISILTWSELRYVEPVDVFVQLHNHQFPAVAACGKHNVFICQFPFPLDSSSAFCNTWSHLANYDRVVVYSKFARENLQRKLNVFRFDRKIDVLYPPVPITRALTKQNCPATSRLVILTIGRFFVGGHNKRHDVLIGALARLRQKGVDAELHIVGALHSEAHHVLHLHALGRMAEGLPAQFHVNATPALVNDLLSRATIYWHATGFDVDPRMEPEKCEHFGISIIEGMAAGCVPFVVANGGPLEFVRDGETGFHYSTIDELVAKTCALACDPLRFAAISQAAVREAALFSDRSFKVKWRTIALE